MHRNRSEDQARKRGEPDFETNIRTAALPFLQQGNDRSFYQGLDIFYQKDDRTKNQHQIYIYAKFQHTK